MKKQVKNFKQYLKQNYINIIIKILLIAIVIVADLLTKGFFEDKSGKVEFIPGFIYFTFVKNTGAAFGIFPNGSGWLVVFSVVFLLVFVLYDIGNKEQNWWSHTGFALIFAGAIGNMVDRLALGYVRDFIALDFMEFPVFNVADISVTIGCVLYIIYLITYIFDIRKRKKTKISIKNKTKDNDNTSAEI